MLKKQMMQEIIDMKMRGYSIGEIREHYARKPGKPPSIPTIRKYYAMDVAPANPGASLAKDKVFDAEPWKSTIVKILRNNPGKCYGSSVYDVLIEHFVENGNHEKLPGEERTLRRYIGYLTESGQAGQTEKNGRIYDAVFDTPPGQQMLIDFGQQNIKGGFIVHFICMLLRYSRMICVYAQDHKFNAEEACRAIYRGFYKLGGRPTELVIDQDSVFIASELYGEIVETHTFKAFTTEQGLKLWVCNKNDPESKGPVENLVKFVKTNFFSARKINCIEDVWRSLPGWVERKNKRIHQATFRIPLDVFTEIESIRLSPLMPSVYETLPTSFTPTYVGDKKYITYKATKYSVPRKFCFKTVYYKVVGDKLHIYGPDRKYECTHDVSPCKGVSKKLPEHAKEDDTDWLKIVESLRRKWNCYDFQHFINGFKKENGRFIYKQLKAVEEFLDSENAERDLVADVMKECCRTFRYQFSQFKVVYERAKASRMSTALSVPAPIIDVQHVSMEIYQTAFLERCDN
jgi:hypothetical protein